MIEGASNSGRTLTHCRHIYEYVNAIICPDCGKDTHEPNWKEINAYHRKWLKENPDAWRQVGWWSI